VEILPLRIRHQYVNPFKSEYVMQSFGAKSEDFLNVQRFLNSGADAVKFLDSAVERTISAFKQLSLGYSLPVQFFQFTGPCAKLIAGLTEDIAADGGHCRRYDANITVQQTVFEAISSIPENLFPQGSARIRQKRETKERPDCRRYE
jgi:hypothetical protein